MGFDISYHPVDPAFLHDELFPIIRGERPGHELFLRAARAAKNRFIANAWGLATLGIRSDQSLSQVEPSVQLPPALPGFFGWLLRAGSSPPPFSHPQEEDLPATLVDMLEPDLHVWGRPFLILAERPEEVSQGIDDYIQADTETATQLAREAIRRINPALLEGAKWPHPKSQSLEQHLRKQIARMPSDEDFLHAVSWKIDLFRKAYTALGTSRKVLDPEGKEHAPDELFSSEFAVATLEFASILRPGWMDRGKVWPTHLMEEAGLDPGEFFQSPEPLFSPLLDRTPQIRRGYAETIRTNFMLGGYVAAPRVPAFLDFLQRNRKRLLGAYDSEFEPEESRICFRKLLEALHDASSRRLGFVEAAEVYSAPLGAMN